MLIRTKIATKNGKALPSKNSMGISTNKKRQTKRAVKYRAGTCHEACAIKLIMTKIITYIDSELASPVISVFYQHNHRKFLPNP
jgi:uncharacterized protein (UPF0371 family)